MWSSLLDLGASRRSTGRISSRSPIPTAVMQVKQKILRSRGGRGHSDPSGGEGALRYKDFVTLTDFDSSDSGKAQGFFKKEKHRLSRKVGYGGPLTYVSPKN